MTTYSTETGSDPESHDKHHHNVTSASWCTSEW